MKKTANNFAFIDSQNLTLAIRDMGWAIDFMRFRVHLKEKYAVTKAYMFIGYIAGNNALYSALQSAGFVCIFRPTLAYKDGTIKGNCDAELVLQAMINFNEYDKAVIVSGDGDFYCLVKHLIEKEKLEALMVPNRFKYSALLKFSLFRPFTRSLNDLKSRLQRDKSQDQKKKGPIRTEP